jgi:hypothetical protein
MVMLLAAGACPDASWLEANGSCYRVTREWVPHWECASLCGANASLACITTEAENAVTASSSPKYDAFDMF